MTNIQQETEPTIGALVQEADSTTSIATRRATKAACAGSCRRPPRGWSPASPSSSG
jgi:hypothetical protein